MNGSTISIVLLGLLAAFAPPLIECLDEQVELVIEAESAALMDDQKEFRRLKADIANEVDCNIKILWVAFNRLRLLEKKRYEAISKFIEHPHPKWSSSELVDRLDRVHEEGIAAASPIARVMLDACGEQHIDRATGIVDRLMRFLHERKESLSKFHDHSELYYVGSDYETV